MPYPVLIALRHLPKEVPIGELFKSQFRHQIDLAEHLVTQFIHYPPIAQHSQNSVREQWVISGLQGERETKI